MQHGRTMMAAYAKKKSVLVLGDYRQTITVVRSLGRAGFDIVLGCEHAHSSTARSRYITAMRVFDNSRPARFCHQLEACLRKDRPDFVFPVGESELRCMLRHDPDRLMALATWIMPDPATVLRCFDKPAVYQLAATLGIPTAPWRSFRDADGLLVDAGELGYPVVVKRQDSSATVRRKKALICHNAAELGEFVTEIHYDPDPASLVLQKYAPGMRHNCHIAAKRGRLVAYFQQKVLRTDESDGTGIGIEGISVAPSPQLRGHCERLLASLDYSGIGCIQFLVDEASGDIAFLEMNARMDSTAALPFRLGIHFPLIALQIAAGERVNTPAEYRVGKRYYSLYGDVNVWLGQRHRLSRGARALAMPWLALRSYHLAFEWRDPLPALHQFWNKAVGVARKRLQRPVRKQSIESGARL
jgi:predicted ATP-grasp superfamily ATP-dependent carboligase